MAPSDQKNGAVLECLKLSKRFDRKKVLDGIDLTVERGEILAILGPSGGGKTVLIQHMAGLLKPDSGAIRFDGRDIAKMNHYDRRHYAKKIGYMFQLGALFDSMTVFENLALPIREHTKMPESTIGERIRAMLSALDLGKVENKLPFELSGGMLKRVGLARALMLEPEVIFCDEPTAGLDPVRSRIVYELIRRVRDQFRATVVVVTHDTIGAAMLADRLVLLRNGRVASMEKDPRHLSQVYRDFSEGSAKFLEGASADEF
jgi:phospholipid/cholesterol/gamma-HCH transport system ATP-binding protein